MSDLTALILNCTLTPSPTSSSTDLLGSQIADEFAKHQVDSETLRIVDHNVMPGVAPDMGKEMTGRRFETRP